MESGELVSDFDEETPRKLILDLVEDPSEKIGLEKGTVSEENASFWPILTGNNSSHESCSPELCFECSTVDLARRASQCYHLPPVERISILAGDPILEIDAKYGQFSSKMGYFTTALAEKQLSGFQF